VGASGRRFSHGWVTLHVLASRLPGNPQELRAMSIEPSKIGATNAERSDDRGNTENGTLKASETH
jgi:hypothetical protein